MNDRYVVQVKDGNWINCAREDLIDAFLGDTTKLPTAKFPTLEDAIGFVTTLRGMMHCGGTDTAFRVIDIANDDDIVWPPELVPKPVEPHSQYDKRILGFAGLVSRILILNHRSPLIVDGTVYARLTVTEAIAIARVIASDIAAESVVEALPLAGKGY